MEGYLPAEWCAVWFIIAIPFVLVGAKKIVEIIREHPDQKMIVALSGAFIFLLSSLKLPSVTGSSSHPTGTGLSAVLYGTCVTAVLGTIVLIFQALLLAHGGLTTLGANICSMGIFGPMIGFLAWMIARRLGANVPIGLAVAAFFSDLFTYVVTSFELTMAYHSAGYMTAFVDFLTNFAVTQIPLSIVEAILFGMFGLYLVNTRPEIIDDAESISKGVDSKIFKKKNEEESA